MLTVPEAAPTSQEPANGNNPEGSPEQDNAGGMLETGMRGRSDLTQAQATSRSPSSFPMIHIRSR